MGYSKYFCSFCGRKFQAEPDFQGEVACPFCGVKFKINAPSPEKTEEDTSFGSLKKYHMTGYAGSGTVYLKLDALPGGVVTLETQDYKRSARIDCVNSFINEIKAAGDRQNPLSINAFEGLQGSDNCYLSMQIVCGATLDRIMTTKPTFDEKLALEIILKISSTLESVWNRFQTWHGNIVPENIMLETWGNANLLNFHVGRPTTLKEALLSGEAHLYMSPEMIRGAQTSWYSDLYALGVLLYRMTVGVTPYDANMPVKSIMELHCSAPFPLPSGRMPGSNVSDAIVELIRKTMEKKPEDRFSSWAEFRNAAKRILAEINNRTGPRSVPATVAETIRRVPGKHSMKIQKQNQNSAKKEPAKNNTDVLKKESAKKIPLKKNAMTKNVPLKMIATGITVAFAAVGIMIGIMYNNNRKVLEYAEAIRLNVELEAPRERTKNLYAESQKYVSGLGVRQESRNRLEAEFAKFKKKNDQWEIAEARFSDLEKKIVDFSDAIQRQVVNVREKRVPSGNELDVLEATITVLRSGLSSLVPESNEQRQRAIQFQKMISNGEQQVEALKKIRTKMRKKTEAAQVAGIPAKNPVKKQEVPRTPSNVMREFFTAIRTDCAKIAWESRGKNARLVEIPPNIADYRPKNSAELRLKKQVVDYVNFFNENVTFYNNVWKAMNDAAANNFTEKILVANPVNNAAEQVYNLDNGVVLTASGKRFPFSDLSQKHRMKLAQRAVLKAELDMDNLTGFCVINGIFEEILKTATKDIRGGILDFAFDYIKFAGEHATEEEKSRLEKDYANLNNLKKTR